jgi:hypothetical protein
MLLDYNTGDLNGSVVGVATEVEYELQVSDVDAVEVGFFKYVVVVSGEVYAIGEVVDTVVGVVAKLDSSFGNILS